MTTVALSHGYPPIWNMGGEVSLHRTMIAAPGEKFVLTSTDSSYDIDGVKVIKIDAENVLDIATDPNPIANQLKALNANIVISQNELSLAAVKAAEMVGAISIVSVHTPPKYGGNLKVATSLADYAIYNTRTSAEQWGEPNALVLHPPITEPPATYSKTGDAYTLLSSLLNKGIEVVLKLATRYPDKRFLVVRSPAEPTHGLPNLEELVSNLPNVELLPRVSPDEVYKYLEQTRILLVPSRYETYGMSAIEAAGYGIPCVHVDTPHVREGIGEGAILVPPLDTDATAAGIDLIEKNYDLYSLNARKRAEWLYARQALEALQFSDFINNLEKPTESEKSRRTRRVTSATRR